MNQEIASIRKTINPLRESIINHDMFSMIKDVNHLKVFMEHHVYAVWDFMSLLKTLQNRLTCVSVPWKPTGNAETRYLINEIVTGEESDTDESGNRISHFELYLRAMDQAGANTNSIRQIIQDCQKAEFNISNYNIPHGVKKFLTFTFETISLQKTHLIASVFTFGREDLIPGMFNNLVTDLNRNFGDTLSVFKYYLDRHIEIDGNHHQHLAQKMVSELCGNNEKKWQEAEQYAIISLKKRKELWDGVVEVLLN